MQKRQIWVEWYCVYIELCIYKSSFWSLSLWVFLVIFSLGGVFGIGSTGSIWVVKDTQDPWLRVWRRRQTHWRDLKSPGKPSKLDHLATVSFMVFLSGLIQRQVTWLSNFCFFWLENGSSNYETGGSKIKNGFLAVNWNHGFLWFSSPKMTEAIFVSHHSQDPLADQASLAFTSVIILTWEEPALEGVPCWWYILSLFHIRNSLLISKKNSSTHITYQSHIHKRVPVTNRLGPPWCVKIDEYDLLNRSILM